MDHALLAGMEAVLFASGDPVSTPRLAEIFEIDKQAVLEVLTALRQRYEQPESGLVLLQLPGGWQLVNKREYAPYIQSALDIKRNIPLSPASMEVLAIVAYNSKPGVTRSFIEQVRGVDSSGVVSNLQEKGLLEEAGRLDLPGKPIAYRVTDNFLRCFGMSSLEELPPLPRQNVEAGAEEEQILVPESTEEESAGAERQSNAPAEE